MFFKVTASIKYCFVHIFHTSTTMLQNRNGITVLNTLFLKRFLYRSVFDSPLMLPQKASKILGLPNMPSLLQPKPVSNAMYYYMYVQSHYDASLLLQCTPIYLKYHNIIFSHICSYFHLSFTGSPFTNGFVNISKNCKYSSLLKKYLSGYFATSNLAHPTVCNKL